MSGYLVDQTYGYAEEPGPGWVFVQADDEAGVFDDDYAAALAAAGDVIGATAPQGTAWVKFCPGDLDEEGEEAPGDWAVYDPNHTLGWEAS